MSKSTSPALPPEVAEGLAGSSPVRDQVTLLATVDSDGSARFSMLSRSVVEVVDRTTLLIALRADSSTARNIERDGRAALFRVDGAVPRTIRVTCEVDTPFTTSSGARFLTFTARVVEVVADEASYASIVSTMDFRLSDPDRALPRWQEIGDVLLARGERHRDAAHERKEADPDV